MYHLAFKWVNETNTSSRDPCGSDTLADMNQPPGHMHEPFLQKGLTCSAENSYRLEANTQGRGTVSLRICHAAKQGVNEPIRIGFYTDYITGCLFGQAAGLDHKIAMKNPRIYYYTRGDIMNAHIKNDLRKKESQ